MATKPVRLSPKEMRVVSHQANERFNRNRFTGSLVGTLMIS